MKSLEEWTEWKLHPSTQEWFKFLGALEHEIKEEWARSTYVGESADETIQRNAAALGSINVLKRLQEANFEDIVEIIYDSKH